MHLSHVFSHADSGARKLLPTTFDRASCPGRASGCLKNGQPYCQMEAYFVGSLVCQVRRDACRVIVEIAVFYVVPVPRKLALGKG
jgi:hypothetical protein